MNPESPYTLGRTSSSFALATAITVIFNTALAWAKDAIPSLNKSMAALTGHHWTTHALADLVLFFALGFIFSKTGAAEKIPPASLITVLIASVIIGGLGLLGWYLVF